MSLDIEQNAVKPEAQTQAGAATTTTDNHDAFGTYNSPEDILANLGWDTASGGLDTDLLNKITDSMTKFAKEINMNNVIDVVQVTDPNLPLPVIAVCMKGQDSTVVFSLLIEKMLTQPIEPAVEIIRDGSGNGHELITDRPTSRCYGEMMRSAITARVVAQLNAKQVIHLHHAVIPKTADLESESTARIYFNTATLALRNCVMGSEKKGITARFLAAKGLVVRQRTKIVPNDARVNMAGQPIASDFTATLTLSAENARQADPNGEITTPRSDVLLAETTGYVDFNIMSIPPLAPNQPAPATQPRYIPVLVYTEINGLSPKGQAIEDLRNQLLGLTTSAALADNHGWVRVFDHPLTKKNGKASIGNLGLEHDPYMRTPPELGVVPVQSVAPGTMPKEGHMTPLMVANLWCTQGVAIALDVEQGGRLEWVQNAFVAATGVLGDAEHASKANAKIVSECDKLSNGIFSKMWLELNQNRMAPVVNQSPVLVHLGTYSDKKGVSRDIRSIDYLSMLSMLPKDLEKLAQGTAAMIPGGSNKQTVSDRRKILQQLAPNINFTGLATRVYLAPGFIQTLIAAMTSAGIRYVSDDPLGYVQLDVRGGMGMDQATVINAGGLYAGPGNTGSIGGASAYFGYVNPMYQ